MHNLIILLPTLLIAASENAVDLEQHVSLSKDKLPLWCNAVIFSEKATDFLPFKRPVEIHQKLSPSFKITRLCNILVIIGLQNTPGSFSVYEDFVDRNFFQISLVVIYLDSGFSLGDVNSLPGRGLWRKEVILVSHEGEVFQFGGSCNYENPVCFLRGISMKVGFNHMPPYLYIKNWNLYADKDEQYPNFSIHPKMNDTELDILNGFEGQLLRHLTVEYLMRFTMIAPKDMQYGSHRNGVWSGKFAQLEAKEVDMIIGIIPGNSERAEIGDYLAPLCNIVFAMVTKESGYEAGWKAPFNAIPLFLWVSLFVSTFLVGVLVCGTHKIHLYILRNLDLHAMKWSRRVQRCLENCMKLMQILLKQPIFNNIKGPSVFIVTGWMIFSVIIGCIYLSSLTARLSLQEKLPDINTMQDVWEQQKTLKTTSGTTLDLYMRTSIEPYTVLVRNHLMEYIKTNSSRTRQPYTEFFYNPNVVATTESQQFIYKVLAGTDGIGRKSLLDFHISPVIEIFGSWMILKNNVLYPALNVAMMRASALGLISKWRNDPIVQDDNSLIVMNENFLSWTFDNDDRGREMHDEEKKAFTMKEFQGIFIMWVFGIFLSLVCFVVELLMGLLLKSYSQPSPPTFRLQYIE